MIILNQNSTNNVIVTVSELQRNTGSLFLFEFYQGISHDKIYCLAYDSSSLNRYNQFCITTVPSGSAVTASAGQIYTPLSGDYNYKIYEVISSGSLDPTGLNVVEQGKMKVLSSSVSPIAFSGSTSNYVVYQG